MNMEAKQQPAELVTSSGDFHGLWSECLYRQNLFCHAYDSNIHCRGSPLGRIIAASQALAHALDACAFYQ